VPLSNSRHPLISIVVAARNYAHFLPVALRSVRAQTYRNWECIIIDDASSDATTEVVDRLVAQDRRIRGLRNPMNLGVSRSRNLGIAAAGGGLIAVLDADDWWHPEKLKTQVDALRATPGGVLCFSNFVESSHDGDRVVACREHWLRDLARGLRAENLILHSSVLVSRAAVAQVGAYNEALRCAEDWDLLLRLLKTFGADSFVHVEQPLAFYRIHGNSASSGSRQMSRDERRVVLGSLVSQGWALRHPFGAVEVIQEQMGRELSRVKRAGARRRAIAWAFGMAAMSPLRRWRWRQFMDLVACR
jgi:glycosyltransferase involved in cell wall biosynthesis